MPENNYSDSFVCIPKNWAVICNTTFILITYLAITAENCVILLIAETYIKAAPVPCTENMFLLALPKCFSILMLIKNAAVYLDKFLVKSSVHFFLKAQGLFGN